MLLRALQLDKMSPLPHLSPGSMPEEADKPNPVTVAEVEVVSNGQELRELYCEPGALITIHWHSSLRENPDAFFERLLTSSGVALRFRFRDTQWEPVLKTADDRFTNQNPERLLTSKLRCRSRLPAEIVVAPQTPLSNEPDFLSHYLKASSSRIVYLRAERSLAGPTSVDDVRLLSPDGGNLPSCMNQLRPNRKAMAELLKIVQRVLPEIQHVEVRPVGGSCELVIDELDQDLTDYRFMRPLSACGSGVQQVVTIAYVLATHQSGSVLLIDEPGSFLHPEAVRSLFQVFRDYPQNQYVVAAHSVEALRFFPDARVFHVSRSGGESSVRLVDLRVEKLDRLHADLGLDVLDLFGVRLLIWVEGPSDAEVVKEILRENNRESAKVAPILHPDSLRKEDRAVAASTSIRESLVSCSGMVPVMGGYFLDRDALSQDRAHKIMQAVEWPLRFTQRRMLENYFLDPLVLAGALATIFDKQVSSKEVEEYVRLRHAARHGGHEDQCWTPKWATAAHGDEIVREVFAQFGGDQAPYVKRAHAITLYRHGKALSSEGALQLEREVLALHDAILATEGRRVGPGGG